MLKNNKMKKVLVGSLTIMVILFLTGCDSSTSEPKPEVQKVCYDQVIGGTKVNPKTRKVCVDYYTYPDGTKTKTKPYYPEG